MHKTFRLGIAVSFRHLQVAPLPRIPTFDRHDPCYSKNPEIMHKEYRIFDLEELDETECVMDFRFTKHKLPILGMALGLPEHFRCKQGTICD